MDHIDAFTNEYEEKILMFELMEKYIDTLFVFDRENPSLGDVNFICMNGNKIQININWENWEGEQVSEGCDCSCECEE